MDKYSFSLLLISPLLIYPLSKSIGPWTNTPINFSYSKLHPTLIHTKLTPLFLQHSITKKIPLYTPWAQILKYPHTNFNPSTAHTKIVQKWQILTLLSAIMIATTKSLPSKPEPDWTWPTALWLPCTACYQLSDFWKTLKCQAGLL